MKSIICLFAIGLISLFKSHAQDFVFSPINVLNGLSDNQVRYIIQLPDGRMVFKTSGNINIYNGARFKYIHQQSASSISLNNYDGFYRIYLSGDNLLWIKDRYKLMCVDLRKEIYLTDLPGYFKKSGFGGLIADVFLDAGQRMWILTGNQLVSKDRKHVVKLSSSQGTLQDVSSKDDELFLFYNNGAIVCHDLISKKDKFTMKAYAFSEEQKFKNTSLVVSGTNGFYQLRNGSSGGFFFFDLKKGSWRKLLETNYTLNTLVVDGNSKAAVSCATGIWIIDCKSGDKQYIPTIEKVDGTRLNTEISTLLYDKQGGLWLGTINQGLLYYHPNRYLFTPIRRSVFPDRSNKDIIVQAFAEDTAGNIYLKCQSKCYRYRPGLQNNQLLEQVESFNVPSKITAALNSKTVRRNTSQTAKLTDSKGWVWTGTADGLKVFNPVSGSEKTLYTSDGLSNNFIQEIFEDRKRDIWISTSYGLNKVYRNSKSENLRFSSFGVSEGTLDGEYSAGAIFESSDRTLYFGGINGFSILKPDRRESARLPFKPVFTNLLIRGEKIEPGKRYDDRLILSNGTAYTKDIELSYHQNFLAFEFSGLNYQNPAQTYYRYQLEGVDKHWRETINPKNDFLASQGILVAAYTNLPPGSYRLKVMVSNNNHTWNGPVSVVNLIIRSPWWQTTLAYVIYTLLLLLGVYAISYFYLRNARLKAERNRREEILLLRIRHLIEQQHIFEEQKANISPSVQQVKTSPENDGAVTSMESAFLKKAMALVESNLHVTDYSVENLSRDLNMDRTGLYRKLITLLDKSPSLFIRNIRLDKAAALLIEGEHNVSEIADQVGFSSSSYLSKCFQEKYGCKPSGYAEYVKKST